MRSARHFAALVAVLLAAPAGALAQETTPTTTEPLGDYTQTTPTETLETTETTETQTETTPTPDDSGVADDSTGGGGNAGEEPSSGAAPEPAPAPTAAEQPSTLAYTGFDAVAVVVLGLALMGGAVVLQRRRRA